MLYLELYQRGQLHSTLLLKLDQVAVELGKMKLESVEAGLQQGGWNVLVGDLIAGSSALGSAGKKCRQPCAGQ